MGLTPTLPVTSPAALNAFINVWSASSNANDSNPGGGKGAGEDALDGYNLQTIFI
jgi:hypothetical protein